MLSTCDLKIKTDEIIDRKVNPVEIKNEGKIFLTLYYFTGRDDCLLNDSKHLIYFENFEVLKDFCLRNNLKLCEQLSMYDFDRQISNPIDYSKVLNNWNLLNTISNIFNMYFEGNSKRYNALYDMLFCYSTPVEPLPTLMKISDKNYFHICKIFKKKNRFLNKFKLYS